MLDLSRQLFHVFQYFLYGPITHATDYMYFSSDVIMSAFIPQVRPFVCRSNGKHFVIVERSNDKRYWNYRSWPTCLHGYSSPALHMSSAGAVIG
jgi:hypothetical protein